MSNLIHLVLPAGSIPLSQGIQNSSFRYTPWINQRLKRTGPLFQGRYKAVLVDRDNYLLELIRYIHLNPVLAGMVAEPDEYLWNSHLAYLGDELVPWLTTDDDMIGMFGKTQLKARADYRSFVLEGIGEESRSEFYGGEEDTRVLGGENFVNHCLSSEGRVAPRLTAQEIADKVGFAYNIDTATLKSKSHRGLRRHEQWQVGWHESWAVLASRMPGDILTGMWGV